MCYKCDEISVKIKISYPHEYISIIEQVKNFIKDNILELVKGTCELDDIGKGKPWPDDIIYHEFKCNSCNRLFEVSVETYHGSGGEWKPKDLI